MDDSSAYGVGLADNVIKNLTVKSLRQSCKDTDTDFSAQINNMKTFGADAVVFTGYHQQAGLLRKQMVEQGLGNVQMFGGDGVKSTEFAAEAGGAANAKGVLCTIGAFGTADPNTLPLYAKFKADYKTLTGKDPSTYAEGNYDAVGTLVAAMEQAGSIDHAAVVSALHSITYTGILGTYGFNADGDIVGRGASANIKTIFHFMNNGTDFVPTTK
jgi:ABC-type branched-subunit amino acid transport system substrate-binding protein